VFIVIFKGAAMSDTSPAPVPNAWESCFEIAIEAVGFAATMSEALLEITGALESGESIPADAIRVLAEAARSKARLIEEMRTTVVDARRSYTNLALLAG
jgi:hypothetical protein